MGREERYGPGMSIRDHHPCVVFTGLNFASVEISSQVIASVQRIAASSGDTHTTSWTYSTVTANKFDNLNVYTYLCRVEDIYHPK